MSEETEISSPGTEGGGESSESPTIFGEDNTFAEGWTSSLGEGFDSLSKFNGKGVEDLARSYSELEKKIGQKTEGMVKIPGEDATDEELAEFHRSLGVPDSVDGYEINLPDDVAEGLDFDPESLGPIKEAARNAGVSPQQLNNLVAAQAEIEKAQMAEWNKEQEEAQAELRKEWGAEADRNTELAKRAAQASGLDPESPLFSNPDIQRAFAALGGKISEGQLGDIKPTSSGMTAAEEARDIQINPDNPLYKAYRGDDTDRQKIAAARKRVEELQSMASK